MIPRILVPKNARPVASASDAPPRRLSSDLDARTLVPSNLPQFELDARSSIPSYFKLEVLGAATVVPRDNMPNTPLDGVSKMPDYVPLTILDSRVAVPKDAHASKIEPKQLVAIQDLPDVLDPDVLTTGEVNLMAQPVEERTSAWNTIARFASIAVHFAVILLILLGPKIFPERQSATAEIARDNVTDLYLPNDIKNIPKVPSPPQPKSPVMRIDPRLLRQLAPPREVQPTPAPAEPERTTPRDNPVPKSDLTAPMPHPQDSPVRAPQPLPDNPTPSLVLPRFSPGKALQDSMHEALKDGGSSSAEFGGPVPGGGGGIGGGGGGGARVSGRGLDHAHPHRGSGFHQLSGPRAGQREAELVRRDAGIGAAGRSRQSGFAIPHYAQWRGARCRARDGRQLRKRPPGPRRRVLDPRFDPVRAAAPAFSGPYIELRFIFLYNVPQNLQ